jgi:hypothetical protein
VVFTFGRHTLAVESCNSAVVQLWRNTLVRSFGDYFLARLASQQSQQILEVTGRITIISKRPDEDCVVWAALVLEERD